MNYTVVIDVSNKESLLLPGMTATIGFIIIDHKNVLLVPNSALSFDLTAEEETSDKRGLFSNLVRESQGQEGPSRPPARDITEGAAKVFYFIDDETAV